MTGLHKAFRILVITVFLGTAYHTYGNLVEEYKNGLIWKEPEVIQTPPHQPPSDAIVLFDGKNLDKWKNGDQWKIKDGYAITTKKDIETKQSFGDCQLHIEWATPKKVEGKGQGRGNSGVFLMGKYEVQILDSYENKTYFDGQAGSIYKQYPPLVNACRKPGEWQTYDIIFTAPRFNEYGQLVKPAYVTVIQNGVVVQNHTELQGATFYHQPPFYTAHEEKLPIQLQFHRNDTQFRNIWVRELSEIQPIGCVCPE
ncbi:3-keto-disaccharide hydrolase [Gimesia maris]|uniref:3-keto-disaccharide hydrolase n=1 Tax=Gimesia maris TaxID=122 RepID=UPI003A953A2E